MDRLTQADYLVEVATLDKLLREPLVEDTHPLVPNGEALDVCVAAGLGAFTLLGLTVACCARAPAG